MFPNKAQSIYLVFSFIALQVLLSIVLTSFGVDWSDGNPAVYIVITAVASAGVIFYALSKMQLSLKSLFHANFNDARTLVLPLTVPLILTAVAGHILIANIEGVYYYFSPQNTNASEYLKKLINHGIFGFCAIVLIVPITEELIFRGIILRGLLANYKKQDALITASVIFAFAHMNPDQLIPTLIIGYFLGWLYVNTYSLWPSIIAHTAINLIAYFIYTSDTPIRGINEFPPGELALPSFSLQILGLITLALGGYGLARALKHIRQ